MNERLVSGGGKDRLNVYMWVSGASAAGLAESMSYQQAGQVLYTIVARE